MAKLRWSFLVAAGVLVAEAAPAGERAARWADATASPRPSAATSEPALRALCAAGDAGLDRVAERLAAGELTTEASEALAEALGMAGEPHVWPRAWVLAGRDLARADAASRLRTWLGTFGDGGERRCGLATARVAGGEETIAVVAVDALADLAPVPRRVRVGAWVSIDALALIEAHGAKVVVLGPDGASHAVPMSFEEGRVRAKFHADREGAFRAQVLLDGAAGPRPVVEATTFAGVEPPSASAPEAAPGEGAGGDADPAAALTRMIAAARATQGLAGLDRDASLDRVALEHTRAMMRAGRIGHDVGDGDPRSRLARAGLRVRASGENVAHAQTVALAHRALWASPSHRENLLFERYDHVGLGVVAGADGTVWVTEVFAGR